MNRSWFSGNPSFDNELNFVEFLKKMIILYHENSNILYQSERVIQNKRCIEEIDFSRYWSSKEEDVGKKLSRRRQVFIRMK